MVNKIYEKIKQFIKDNYKYLIVILITLFLCLYELPYQVYTPGGIINLNERINMDEMSESSGSLNMSYVSVKKGIIPVVLLSYVIPNWDLVKNKDITDSSLEKLEKLEKLEMASSIDNATIVAYNNANKSIDNIKTIFNVIDISNDSDTSVELYDIILKVDGKEFKTIDELHDIINSHDVGDVLDIIVLRDNKKINVNAKIYDSNGEKRIGIAFLYTYEYDTDPSIEVSTKSSESGSSGGLMLSLAIYNDLVDIDITKGKTIVGTGTIDSLGNVGEIAGVKYKMMGASKNKADLFICPNENLEEAQEVNEEYNLNLTVVGVSTFQEALDYLENM